MPQNVDGEVTAVGVDPIRVGLIPVTRRADIEGALDDRRCNVNDPRSDTPLYTVTQAARLVGMSPSTLVTWAKGYERRRTGKTTVAQGPVITAIDAAPGMPSIPFVGLVESTVVEAFRRSGRLRSRYTTIVSFLMHVC
ncbi:MAG: hypothetical protein ACE37B_19660 [Ilumatobacter sp.]|uniref:hypothetical protein n=1 Tax=Ilumatobacter sp. TaxID=1967498 RepID=UPI00391DDCD9